MTRTERAVFPRAIIKDRHLNKSGLDRSLRKEGAGPHNWGRPEDQLAAYDDDQFELDEESFNEVNDDASSNASDAAEGKARQPSNVGITEEELAAARKFRKKALKGQVDLAAIARTSGAVSASPPKVTSPSAASETSVSTLPV
ncbi:hypothetical protein D9758_005374 [Tetrapyrgos nigripes]|uniref:Hyaluronan/mRNA-binding protein domain-containing protein n=1 Tax=Tetrapyrgos nigripes TaxID=182062 RepID=A0A8H5GHU2_9AGAR|nr:hypothetical protein D9758_005374 [Tetrapyrgos nigripes]